MRRDCDAGNIRGKCCKHLTVGTGLLWQAHNVFPEFQDLCSDATRAHNQRAGFACWPGLLFVVRIRLESRSPRGAKGASRLLAQSGRFASEPEAVALDCALRFESPPNSRPSMVCSCRASCFCRFLSSYRCCRSSRRLRRLINGRRHAGTVTASCRAIISHRITAFQLTPRKLRFCAWRAATGALGISIQSHVITGTMATGTISAGLAFTAVATMAAVSALAGRGRRSDRSGIAAD
jgi:hypothetical protein